MSNTNWTPGQRLQWWKTVLGVAMFFVFLLIVGTMDYYAEKEDYCERAGKEYDAVKDQCLKPCERNEK